jgi:hypothetical protein
MLHFSDLARLQVVNAHRQVIPVVNGSPRVANHQAREKKAGQTSPLDRYLEGWAKVNLEEILDAIAAGYRFHDPLVGIFSPRSLHEYFDILMNRCSRSGAVMLSDIAFELNGPMEEPSHLGRIWFWREAPRIGLTGITQIEVGEQGIVGESVAYEGNLVSDMLRRASE